MSKKRGNAVVWTKLRSSVVGGRRGPRLAALTIAAGLTLAQFPAVAAAAAWTEAQIVDAFLAEGPQIKALSQQVGVAQAEVTAAGVWANPVADAGREQIFQSGGQAESNRLSLSASLPIFGKVPLRQAAARAGVTSAEAQVRYESFLLSQTVRHVVAKVALGEARVQAIQSTLHQYTRLEGIVAARVREGETAGYDLVRLRLAADMMRARLADDRLSVVGHRGTLAGLLGRPIDGPLRLAELTLPPSADVILARARDARGDLTAVRAAIEQARESQALAERSRWPDPDLSLGLKQTIEPTVNGLGYVAGLSWPLPLLDQAQGDRARTAAQVALQSSRLDSAVRQLQAALPAAHTVVVERLQAVTRFRQGTLTQLPEIARIAEQAYAEGAVGIVQLLDAQEAALMAELQHLDLAAAARSAYLDLERLVGTRLSDLQRMEP